MGKYTPKDWRFEKRIDDESKEYVANYEIVFSTPIRQTLSNSSVHCANAASSTAVQVASNRKSGYCNAVPTMVYEQNFIIHCWQFANTWERTEHIPASVGVRLLINMPTVRIPCDCLDFTPSIKIDNILESISPFKGHVSPYKLDSIDITVYLFVGADPVINVEYATKGNATYGNCIDNRTELNWNGNRENELKAKKNEIIAEYSADDSSVGQQMACEFITNPFTMIRELDDIKTNYPELYKWYSEFIETRKKELKENYPESFEKSIKNITRFGF